MTANLFDLSGKVAVVTGGARGLGQAAAVGLATYGADVAVIDLATDTCGDSKRDIEALGRTSRAYGCDVADENAVAATVSQIAAEFGRIDILVNIAGITARIPTDHMPAEQVRRLTEVNYYGTFWMCKEVGKVMLAQGSGNIVNMSALGGGFLGTGRGNAAYSATKGAIAALTKELACEWGTKGIRVNAVAPCYFDTEMCAAIKADPVREPKIRDRIPAGRWGKPEELIGPLLFLASDASNYVDGHVLVVDGGWMGR